VRKREGEEYRGGGKGRVFITRLQKLPITKSEAGAESEQERGGGFKKEKKKGGRKKGWGQKFLTSSLSDHLEKRPGEPQRRKKRKA